MTDTLYLRESRFSNENLASVGLISTVFFFNFLSFLLCVFIQQSQDPVNETRPAV